MAVTFDSCRSGFSRELWPFGPGEPKSSRLKPLLPGQSASGCLARHALVLRQVVVRRGAQLMRIEVVDHDRVERQRAQLLELHALVGGDRKSTRLNFSHSCATRMPSSACKKKNPI